jgi:hypothetical protein
MNVRTATHWLTIGVTVTLLVSLGAAQDASSHQISASFIVDGLEKAQSRAHPPISYQVIREYRLSGANDSGGNSEVVAEVDFNPPSSRGYKIQKTSGSSRGQEVVRRVLDQEVEAASSAQQARIALTRENYDFALIDEPILDGHACYRVKLIPKRKEYGLIAGEVWIDKDSFAVRQIEGEVAKTPSWWLRKVSVKLVFSAVEGTWLQTSMQATADVRIVGVHTLTSRLVDYRGAHEVASADTHDDVGKQPTPTSLTRLHH